MIKVLADALVPIFAGLLLGYIAGRRRVMDNQNVHNLIIFVMSFAVPCSLFLAIARTPRAALREQAGTVLVLTIVYVVLYVLSFFWARSGEKLRASDSGVLALTISFPNIAAVGLPLLADVFGVKSLVTVATSIALGSVTISVVTLAFLEADGNGSGDAFSFRQVGPVSGSCSEETDCVGAAAGVCLLLRSLAFAFLPGSISHRAGLGGGRICPGAYWPCCFRSEVRTRGKDADTGFAEECLAAGARSRPRDPASFVD